MPGSPIVLSTRLLKESFKVRFRNGKPWAIGIVTNIMVLQILKMCELTSKLLQNSIFKEKPQPGMLLHGHPGGVH